MPLDGREALVETVTQAVVGLLVADARADHPAIAAEVAKLLTAVAAYNRARPARASDQPLRAAVERLAAGWQHP